MDILCDIDGTLADLTHRRDYITSKPKNWKAFEAGIPNDTVIGPIAGIVNALYDQGHTVILCSGRGEQNREVTERWLQENNIRYHGLFMRKEGDYRADNIIKEELLNDILSVGFNPILVIDDRKRVLEMWRRRGILTLDVNGGGDF